jgi:hypothetical protein
MASKNRGSGGRGGGGGGGGGRSPSGASRRGGFASASENRRRFRTGQRGLLQRRVREVASLERRIARQERGEGRRFSADTVAEMRLNLRAARRDVGLIRRRIRRAR